MVSKPILTLIDDINKRFGEGSSFILGHDNLSLIPVIPTGSLNLDIALEVGGVPKGRIIEIYGDESSGKTTLCQHIIANCQSLGGICVFVDSEHAGDPTWFDVCNIDIDNLIVSQPDTGENALDIVELYVRGGADLVIVDSVAALVPRAEIEGDMGDSHMGLQARLMSQAMRKLTAAVRNHNVCLIFTNQTRQNIGQMFGSPTTTTGGKALKFYSSVRIQLSKGPQIKEKDVQVGNKVKAFIRKNKVAPPFRVAEFTILYDLGISYVDELIELGSELGIIQKKGSWYKIGDEQIGQGLSLTRNTILEQPEWYNLINDQVRLHYNLPLMRNNGGK